jgi:hypothetical protein
MPRPLRVFLCHAKEDKPIVRDLYRQLSAEVWMDVWLDEIKLLPGQEWDIEIEKAVEQADVVIVCLSNKSVDKEGYIQKELRFVLNIADEKPEGTIFVVPLRFDDCLVPRRIRAWQYLDYFLLEQKSSAYQRLLESLRSKINTPLYTSAISDGKSSELRELETKETHVVPANIQECPFCGKYNKLENTFRCKNCHIPFLCLNHLDSELLICIDCARKSKLKVALTLSWEGTFTYSDKKKYVVFLDDELIGDIRDDKIQKVINPGMHKIKVYGKDLDSLSSRSSEVTFKTKGKDIFFVAKGTNIIEGMNKVEVFDLHMES